MGTRSSLKFLSSLGTPLPSTPGGDLINHDATAWHGLLPLPTGKLLGTAFRAGHNQTTARPAGATASTSAGIQVRKSSPEIRQLFWKGDFNLRNRQTGIGGLQGKRETQQLLNRKRKVVTMSIWSLYHRQGWRNRGKRLR